MMKAVLLLRLGMAIPEIFNIGRIRFGQIFLKAFFYLIIFWIAG